MASETQTPLTTENTEITERFQVGPSEAIHSDPRALDPLGQLADVDLILLGRVSLLRILLSVISVLSVVIRSSYLPESSPRLSAPARTCGRGRLARFSLPQRLAVWWVALPWPILPVPAVLLALCRVVVRKYLSFNALHLRFRLVASDFPGIVCILDGDRSGAGELTDRLLRSSISSFNAGFAGL